MFNINKLTILIHPMPEMGHLLPCIGLAEVLLSRGHNIVFVVEKPFKGQLVKYGFEEEVLKTPLDPNNTSDDLKPGEHLANIFLNSGELESNSSINKLKISIKGGFISHMVKILPSIELELKAILVKHKPDVIIIDHFVTSPTVMYSGKPWVFICVLNPIGIEDEMTPPMGSGYPTNSDKNGWKEFQQLYRQFFSSVEYNEYLKSNGFPTKPDNRVTTFSPFLNLYNYPKELDYTDIRPVPDKWFGVDTFIRKGEEPFELPAQLKGYKDKLIYLSLGSMGSVNIELMKRLVNILSKSKHKFIVSKGLFGDKYELADNMWGQRSVPQTKVLPLVDLVLTHGGNNTVTESVYFGKPMIVLPLFGDQFDNAQRVHEKGFGMRFDPYLCSEEELLNAIEILLNDNELKEILFSVSNRMQSSNKLELAVDMIENLVN